MTFQTVSPGDESFDFVDIAAGGRLPLSFNRSQLLIMQYTKLLNYYIRDLDPDWGGDYYLASDAPTVEQGLKRFLTDTGAYDLDVEARWLRKKVDALPWSPSNFKLSHVPCPSLGAPYEMYIGLSGSLCTLNQASRILCVDAAALAAVKLRLLLDEQVIAEAIKLMLRPRPTWTKVRAASGQAGKTVRSPISRSKPS